MRELYHYTNKAGYDALTSGCVPWLPSVGPVKGYSSVSVSVQPFLSHELPPESIWKEGSLAKKISLWVAFAAKALPGEFDEHGRFEPPPGINFDIHYGAGWYATSLPPATTTVELLQELWQGKPEFLDKTAYWLQVAVDETQTRVEIPDKSRAGVVFIPIVSRQMTGDPPRPCGISGAPVFLVRAGKRSEGVAGHVDIETLYEPETPVRLVEPFAVLVDGFAQLPKRDRNRLCRFLGIEDQATLDNESERLATGSSVVVQTFHPPFDKSELVNESDRLFRLGRLGDALNVVEQLLSKNPDCADGWSNKGAIIAALGRKQEALACYDRAIRIQPNNAKALSNKAAALINLGRFQEAVCCCDLVLAGDPTNAEALTNKANALVHLGRDQESLVLLEQAIQLLPSLPEAWNSRGAMLLRRASHRLDDSKGAPREAVQDLRLSLESFLTALDLSESNENARANLRQAVDLTLEALPRSYQCEQQMWRAAARDEDILTRVTLKVFPALTFELHPRYSAELAAGAYREHLSDTEWVKHLMADVLGDLLRVEMSPSLLPLQADERIRLGLHLLNSALTKAGLLEVPLATGNALSSLLKAAGETLQVAKSLNDVGVAYRRLGEPENALECYEEAIRLYERCGDRKFCGHVLFNRGFAYEVRGRPGDVERARAAYQAALAIYAKLGLGADKRATRKRLDKLEGRTSGFLSRIRQMFR